MKLEGQVALVTGGGGGIGRGIALAMAEEGADVAVADIDYVGAREVAEEMAGLRREAIAIEVDVTKSDQVQFMVRRTIEDLGEIDILVNSAGTISVAPVEELREGSWDRVMDVNAKGVFLCCKAAIRHMRLRGSGKIINVASIAGKNGYATVAHYCASKFAVVGFTNAFAKEVARNGITVNAICPGNVRTDVWESQAAAWREPGESIEACWRRHVDTNVPQGRGQTPEDMGALAVYFATADNVTGQAFNVDGGQELH